MKGLNQSIPSSSLLPSHDLSMAFFAISLSNPLFLASHSSSLEVTVPCWVTPDKTFPSRLCFRTTGLYTKTLAKIIRQDISRFLVLFAFVFLSFCGALFLAVKGSDAQKDFRLRPQCAWRHKGPVPQSPIRLIHELVKFFISISDQALQHEFKRRKSRTVRLVFNIAIQALWQRIRMIFRNKLAGNFRLNPRSD